MIRTAIKILTLALLGAAAPVAAQKAQPLKIEIKEGWTHPQSGLVFPKTISGLPFSRATQFVDGGWDNSLQYDDAGMSEIISVYIYQAAVQDVGMLFAESRKPLEMRKDYYGSALPYGDARSFSPPGQEATSGLRMTFDTGGAYRSTALAIAPHGRDWIVKFRISSKSKSAAELDAVMSEAIAALTWPKDETVHSAAKAIADCSGSLPEFKKAKPVKDDGASAILNAALFGVVAEKSEEASVEKSSYCRDQSVPFPLGIYRPDAATDRYLISLGDSGRAVFVEPDIAAALLEDNKKGGTRYSVRFVGPGSVDIFPPHDRMPSPQQAVEIIDGMAPVATTGRGDGDNTVNINASALK